MVLVIDNYDSFTFNLVQYLGELGADVVVLRNHESLSRLMSLRPSALVVSPGPCSPKEAGVSIEAISFFAGRIPVLGVCLGHQSLAAAFGGRIVRAPQVRHGKTSKITHNGDPLFKDVPNPFVATRYHSLIVDKDTLPSEFTVTAWAEDIIMGLRHEPSGALGVQFHPESILTQNGKTILGNFLAMAGVARAPQLSEVGKA
ncbi:MAG: aminodeoxychorismate/anthranilate synthase component II [Alicyclobacillus herbarius]|uniref:anthranilate synthase component II n=1 Tax=Alicyclobacillus herbarius TaxID=122960 RepID=UPI000402B99C|nr:aminodeoxychorismate/anthranilate synthase component II [Alicyclobacillus herbarius]MCL6632703.1 aminodeoxychorismate/anthranilate synthase component II [Alicyclobacillus herbarius]